MDWTSMTFVNIRFEDEEKAEILRGLGYEVEIRTKEVELWKEYIKNYDYYHITKDGVCLNGDYLDSYAIDKVFEKELKKKLLSLWD